LELFYRKKGDSGEPLIILHGLYGSSDNWMSIAHKLKDYFQVYLIDQRNHGRSPHSPEMNYDLFTADLYAFFKKHNIGKAHILGHSMGGKTAMWFALKYPNLVNKLIIVDIAPKTYDMSDNNSGVHKMIISALKSAEPETAKYRKDIESRLNNHIPNPQLNMFLLKNIERNSNGTYSWRLNINSIDRNLEKIMNGFSELTRPIGVPTLFLKGELSNYIKQNDSNRIKHLFPDSEIVTILDAGHWLHAQQPELFVKTVLEYLMGQ
jgi:pimeloyl-ACP methyl ester carboxylesterase